MLLARELRLKQIRQPRANDWAGSEVQGPAIGSSVAPCAFKAPRYGNHATTRIRYVLRMRGIVLTLVWMVVAAATGGSAWALERLAAESVMRYPAPLAQQAVAVGANAFFAVNDTGMARHARRGGRELARWQSVGRAGVAHLNSCVITRERELLCANSNFPDLPMAGSLEWFDPATLAPVRSRSLGATDGSLAWVDELASGWLAGFAHYDGEGGQPGKDHRYTRIVQFDPYWVPVQAWLLPDSVLERLRPDSTSGGTIGADGLLYVTGHDRGEVYALARPSQGATLVHVATIALEIAARSIAWDRFTSDRILWTIDPAGPEVRTFRVPRIVMPAGLTGFDSARMD